MFPAMLNGGAIDFLGTGGHKHLFLLGVHSEVGLLRHRVIASFEGSRNHCRCPPSSPHTLHTPCYHPLGVAILWGAVVFHCAIHLPSPLVCASAALAGHPSWHSLQRYIHVVSHWVECPQRLPNQLKTP